MKVIMNITFRLEYIQKEEKVGENLFICREHTNNKTDKIKGENLKEK